MSPTNIVLLACGSFNPPTYMHLRMFEIARDHLHRLGTHVVIGGLISPVHDGYGKKELESFTHRVTMIKLALQNNDWIKLSDWECKQESWCRTRQVLQFHQNHINSILHPTKKSEHFNNVNEDDITWMPDVLKNGHSGPVQVKLLCGGDLLESFGTPGLWSDDDIDAIVGHHGLVVISRSNTNPLEFIYNSDILTKYMSNITIVTEWITNEISSTKIRRALRRSESVKYLLSDKVIDYIHKYNLYGSKETKYLSPTFNQSYNFLTPSPSNDVTMHSPSPTKCMIICNNNLFSSTNNKSNNYNNEQRLYIDTVDCGIQKTNLMNTMKHPGQAVKIITENTGEHKIFIEEKIKKEEVRKEWNEGFINKKNSKSFVSFNDDNNIRSNNKNLMKGCKSCDENLIKFIFTKHGIQVISDIETIV